MINDTLHDVEKIILNGMVPEEEKMSFIARRRFLKYMLSLPADLFKSYKNFMNTPLPGSSTSNADFVKQYKLY